MDCSEKVRQGLGWEWRSVRFLPWSCLSGKAQSKDTRGGALSCKLQYSTAQVKCWHNKKTSTHYGSEGVVGSEVPPAQARVSPGNFFKGVFFFYFVFVIFQTAFQNTFLAISGEKTGNCCHLNFSFLATLYISVNNFEMFITSDALCTRFLVSIDTGLQMCITNIKHFPLICA